jgi:hypothetical protein
MTVHESGCITERKTAHGYWWRYKHSHGEPLETLIAAIRVAAEVAAGDPMKPARAAKLT